VEETAVVAYFEIQFQTISRGAGYLPERRPRFLVVGVGSCSKMA
jgi:hypothetical protein